MTMRDRLLLSLMAALCALPPLSIDMGLPSLPSAATALGVTANHAALTVTLFMAGFAFSPIFYGTLSDRWGRRPLLLFGLLLFALGGLACVFAPTLPWLLVARMVQGAGAGCGPTLSFAATRDRLSGRSLGQRLAMLTMLLNTAPVVAPSLGTLCLAAGGWRGVYVTLAVCGVGLLLAASVGFAETRMTSIAGETSRKRTMGSDTRALLSHAPVLFPGLIYGLSAASMFAYVSTSPLLLMQTLGASPTLYAGLFALTGSAIVAGAFLSGRALHRLAPTTLVLFGLVLSIAGPIGTAILLGLTVTNVVAIVSGMVVATFGYGLIAPAAAHATLDPVPDLSGTASALMNSFQMGSMALASLCGSLLFASAGRFAPSIIMVVFSAASALGLVGWRVIGKPALRI
jgi:DHA1 family bicyclomycin/chloramphenicol resistance-like MFS transporter